MNLASARRQATVSARRIAPERPATESVIEQSTPAADAADLLPHILFSYTVAGQTYRRELEFPGGVPLAEK